MTVYLTGHNYKYEMENIVRMFFPLQKFEYRVEETPSDEEFLCIAVEDPSLLKVTLYRNGKTVEKTTEFSPDPNEANHCERELGKLLYRVLQQETGISPQWGIITGVRPVKLFEQKMEEGFSEWAEAHNIDLTAMGTNGITILQSWAWDFED